MATTTPRWGLRKPDPTDTVNVATDINATLDVIDQYLGGARRWVDIKGVTVADGTTNDAAAINAAIAASPPGSVIYFAPGYTWAISTPIIMLPGRTYTGLGNGLAGANGAARIKALTGFTGGGLMVAAAWFNNETDCDEPIRVQGLELDGNSVAGTRGLILCNFWSRVYDVSIRGTTSHGIELNDRTANGTNIIVNSSSENVIDSCRFEAIGGDGIHQESNNSISNQDGRITNCYLASIAQTGINLGRAAGWYVIDNHLYDIGYDAIQLTSCYATIVRGNYVEDFGGQNLAAPGAPTFGFYNGISLTSVLDTRASIVEGNTVSTAQPSSPAGNRWTCFYARAGSAQLRAMVVFANNSAVFAGSSAPAVPRSYAMQFGETGDTGRLLTVEYGVNQIEQVSWWQLTRVVGAGVALNEAGRAGVVPLIDGTTVAVDAARGRIFKLAAAGNRTILAPSNPVDGQGMIIAHTATGGARTLALTTGSAGAFQFGTDITALTSTGSGLTDYIGCVHDATAARWRVVSYVKGFA